MITSIRLLQVRRIGVFWVIFHAEVEDETQHGGLDVSHLRGAVLGAQELVNAPKAPSQRRVKVVLDGVVCSA